MTDAVLPETAEALPAAPLTPAQRRVLDLIQAHVTARGYAPTLREMMRVLGIRSTNGISETLDRLERKGYIRRDEGKSRAIILVATPGAEPPPVESPLFDRELTILRSENTALRALLRRVVHATERAPLTPELSEALGEASMVLRGGW